MKIVKHYWFIAIALITMISFSSCESDEERGFDISGLYGKTWWGEMGFEDPYGERLYSYITFTSGAFPDHGVGTEERCYYDDELYRVYKLDLLDTDIEELEKEFKLLVQNPNTVRALNQLHEKIEAEKDRRSSIRTAASRMLRHTQTVEPPSDK